MAKASFIVGCIYVHGEVFKTFNVSSCRLLVNAEASHFG